MLPIACTVSARLKLIDDRTVSVAVAARLVHHVADIVDHIGVVASAAIHLVGTNTAIQRVIARATKQRVISDAAVHVSADWVLGVSLNTSPSRSTT